MLDKAEYIDYNISIGDNNMYKVGDKIKIIQLDDKYGAHYAGREGVITVIDDMGQLHGTWGGLALIPSLDKIVKIGENTNE